MVKLSVPYGPAALEDYHASMHLPLVGTLPDLARFEASLILGSPAPYHWLWFEHAGVLEASMGSEAGQAAVADIPNFGTGGATAVISEID
jgi:uncharacterized protein (TIGR02118 family)